MGQKAIPGQVVGRGFNMGRIRIHGVIGNYPLGKNAKNIEVELEDTSVIDYYEKGILPKSRIPDDLPGVFDS